MSSILLERGDAKLYLVIHINLKDQKTNYTFQVWKLVLRGFLGS
jgi:hypothetical protein